MSRVHLVGNVMIDPLGYFDFLCLTSPAKVNVTAALKVPCFSKQSRP
jgi:hypothetical protein